MYILPVYSLYISPILSKTFATYMYISAEKEILEMSSGPVSLGKPDQYNCGRQLCPTAPIPALGQNQCSADVHPFSFSCLLHPVKSSLSTEEVDSLQNVWRLRIFVKFHSQEWEWSDSVRRTWEGRCMTLAPAQEPSSPPHHMQQ